MKKINAVILIITVLSSMFSSATASTVKSVYVRSGEQETITINLQAKQKVIGAFNISGSREDLIDFWVRDPTGAIVLDSGTVADGENFTFTANSNGEYTLNFENNVAYTKFINLEYDIESEILPNLSNSDVLICIVIGAVAVGLLLTGIGIYVMLRRNRNKPPNPPST